MAYRDRRLGCPRCGSDLAAYPQRDKWRCRGCVGVLVGPGELAAELGEVAWASGLESELTGTRLGCPACGEAMRRISIGGVELDRCDRDEHVWFDGGELGRLRAYLATAFADQHQLAARVLALLVENPDALPR
jgi:Zn-finger nucleic acid-binding protein